MNQINKNLSFFAIILMVVSACSTAEEQIDNSNSIQETESDTDPVKYTLSVGVEGGGTVSTEGGSFDA